MIGQARQQRTGRNIGDMADRPLDLAFLTQGGAEIDDCRILDAGGEIEQHAIGAEIVHLIGRKILDQGQGAIAQQRRPIIIGAHLHAPFLISHGERTVDRGITGIFEIVLVVGDVMPPQNVHPVGPWNRE